MMDKPVDGRDYMITPAFPARFTTLAQHPAAGRHMVVPYL